MMERRFILFIILTFLVFVGFQYLMPKKVQPPAPPPVAQTAGAPETAQPASTPEVTPAAPVPAPAATPDAPSATAATATAVSAQDTKAAARKIIIEGDLYRAVLDNRGGVLTSWELNDYRTTKKSGEREGRHFDMISGASRQDLLYPGALFTDDKAVRDAANTGYYEIKVMGEGIEGTEVAALPEKLVPPVAVQLLLRRGDLQIEKTWRFDEDNYTAGVSINATRNGRPLEGRFFLGEDIGPVSEHFISSSVTLSSVYFSGGKLHRESPPKDQSELVRIDADVRWAGLDMQYFSMVAIPNRPVSHFNIQSTHLQETNLDGGTAERSLLKVLLPLNQNGSSDYRLYLGPKDEQNLRRAGGTDLSSVIDYGMFAIIVHPLLSILRWINQFAHNYGWSIVILTFILALILFPLRIKSMISMKKMSALAPQVKAIQDKYRQYKATDPRKRDMNAEVMALYKEHNANPMSGCLPLLPQLPLLYAFYSMLACSIDLRQAPFILWIHDLSAKDPYYVLPIVMGLTMFLSQKMAPAAPSTDPTQAKMMMVLPLVFTFFFLSTSSGLNLYFLCSNIFQIAFQKIAERWLPAIKAAPIPVKAKAKKG